MPSFDQQVSRERAAGVGAARARNAIAGACANELPGFVTTLLHLTSCALGALGAGGKNRGGGMPLFFSSHVLYT